MNILLSCLNYRTDLMLKLGKKMTEEFGYNCFYLTDDSWTEKKVRESVGEERVLVLRSNPSKIVDICVESQNFFEQIYIKDRYIRKKTTKSKAIQIFNSWSNEIEFFINENNISYLVIEGTPAFELIAEKVANRMQVKVLSPAPSHYPRGKSIVYTDSAWTDAVVIGNNKLEIENSNKAELLTKRVKYVSSPPTFKHKVINFIAKRSINSPTRFAQLYNICINKFTKTKYEKIENIPAEDYVVYFCHVEPEKSVDNAGSLVWPQSNVILKLRQELPEEVLILVKLHPDAPETSNQKIVNVANNLSGCKVISASSENYKLVLGAKFISTISGSIGIESAMNGKLVYTFGKPFFRKHPNVFTSETLTSPRQLLNTDSVIELEKANEDYLINISGYLQDFHISDTVLCPEVLDDDNITRIAHSLFRACTC